MKDKGLYIIIAAVFFSPLALLLYIEWYWVLLIYNIFWAAASYAAHSETKNPKISAKNAFLIPLVFNLIGFGYVAMKLNDDDETVEPKSNDEIEAAKSRLRENILGSSTIEDKIENLIIDGNKVEKTLSYYSSGKLKKENYSGEDNLGREIYTYKEYYESGSLKEERVDEREEIKWVVSEYYESGKLKTLESKYILDKITENYYCYHKCLRDDSENSIEEVYCYGVNKVSIFFDENGKELHSNNSEYEIDVEIKLREFFNLKKAKKQESDNKESDEKVKLYITEEPILVTKKIFDEFEYRFSNDGYCECFELEGNLNIDFGSSIEMAVDVIKLLDPNGKYFLYNEFGVSYDNGSWTTLYELSFINCKIPEFLQDKYDGQLLIEDNSENEIKYALSNSAFFKKITKSYSEGNIEIGNGVECFKYDDFNFQKFFSYASEINESSNNNKSVEEENKNIEFKNFIKNLKKHINEEDVDILFHPERWDVTEKMISEGKWNDKDYTVYANVSLKGVEMCYDNSLKDLIKEIESKKNIYEINAKEIEGHLYNNGDSGGDVDIEKVEWETPLTKQEEKELEEYGGEYQLYNNGDWGCDEVVYQTGNIYRIEVTIGDNKYTIEKNDNVENVKENSSSSIEIKEDYSTNGEIQTFFKSGKIETELFKDSSGTGYYKKYYESGQLEINHKYLNGMIEGVFETYFENGNLYMKRNMIADKADGETIKYFENGNIESSAHFKNDLKNGIEKQYYENGNLCYQVECKDGLQNGKVISYDEDGNKVMESTMLNGNLEGNQIVWWANGKLKAERVMETNEIISEKIYNEKGIEIDNQKETKDKILNTKLKERKILSHEIMTKGYFRFDLDDGSSISVFGQRHSLFYILQEQDDEEWFTVDREFVDEFHLTDYEKGYKYDDEGELQKFLKIDESPEWNCNGFSTDWCGIEEEDDNETRQKKWNEYKAKFPKATSIEHFDIENKKS